ncbi:hypothetical protein [Wolbachia endosymbiont of Pentalonia nigronervosa]|nr:hypothetical protein [Wolbachia endosymbiont of Pentalonia nigronervosa]
MVYSIDLREKAVSLVEKGKSKAEVTELWVKACNHQKMSDLSEK